jgi:RanGTP-binding protein
MPTTTLTIISSARGNTSLESAVTLTKSLRWDIQALGARLARAVSIEEVSQSGGSEAKSPAERSSELRLIVQEIRKLLLRIEDAVPLINLAITTSGASLSTTLPASVSPSRLLQASTFLTAGDAQFSIDPNASVPVGPAFALSVYMLFAGHTQKVDDDRKGVRHTKWKEAIHKARVKLMRVPLVAISGSRDEQLFTKLKSSPNSPTASPSGSSRGEDTREAFMPSEGKANEFAYQLEIIEDLDDDRVHSFEDGEPQPGPYGGVQLAGIREIIPIHQISKIFYANTGRILNIGSDEGPNSPVLLLKRDLNAQFPRKMMERSEQEHNWHEEQEDIDETLFDPEDSQLDIDRQLRYESFVKVSDPEQGSWCFPPNLDPEWLAFEVYTEADDESSDDDQDTSNGPAYASSRPSYSARNSSANSDYTDGFLNLHLESLKPRFPKSTHEQQMSQSTTTQILPASNTSTLGPIRTSLSLLEVLIRLTSLQQFQQASHLAISDELLTFFLEDSSTTGAGGDREERRRTRNEAAQKVGFDPYTDSPTKARDEQRDQNHENGAYEDRHEPATPYYDYESGNSYRETPSWSRERSSTPYNSEWLHNTLSSRRATPDIRSSPQSPMPRSRAKQPLLRTQQSQAVPKAGSPLGRGKSVNTDSSLGTSPRSPSLENKTECGDEP